MRTHFQALHLSHKVWHDMSSVERTQRGGSVGRVGRQVANTKLPRINCSCVGACDLAHSSNHSKTKKQLQDADSHFAIVVITLAEILLAHGQLFYLKSKKIGGKEADSN